MRGSVERQVNAGRVNTFRQVCQICGPRLVQEANAQQRRTWLSSKCARPLWPSLLVGLVVSAALDLGFGITLFSIARFILLRLVLLGLVMSILDYRSDD